MDSGKAASAIALPVLSRPAIVFRLSAWSSHSLQRYESLLQVEKLSCVHHSPLANAVDVDSLISSLSQCRAGPRSYRGRNTYPIHNHPHDWL